MMKKFSTIFFAFVISFSVFAIRKVYWTKSLIKIDRLGPARLGMNFAEFSAIKDSDVEYEKVRDENDWEGVLVKRTGKELLRVWFTEGESFEEISTSALLTTLNFKNNRFAFGDNTTIGSPLSKWEALLGVSFIIKGESDIVEAVGKSEFSKKVRVKLRISEEAPQGFKDPEAEIPLFKQRVKVVEATFYDVKLTSN